MSDDDNANQMRLLREHQARLEDVLGRVRARGGPASRWNVDLGRRRAELAGTMEVYFDVLRDGGFSDKGYRRIDRHRDWERDLPLYEDAIACFAEAVSRAGPDWYRQG
jgi:hypothetical protein